MKWRLRPLAQEGHKWELFLKEGKMTGRKIFIEPELIKYEESLDEVTLMPFTSTPKWSDVYRDRLNIYLSDTVY